MNPGIKSTEFLMSLVPVVLGLILVVIGALKAQQQLVDTGMYLLLGGTGGYGISRGIAKLGAGIGGTTPPPGNDKVAAAAVANIK